MTGCSKINGVFSNNRLIVRYKANYKILRKWCNTNNYQPNSEFSNKQKLYSTREVRVRLLDNWRLGMVTSLHKRRIKRSSVSFKVILVLCYVKPEEDFFRKDFVLL